MDREKFLSELKGNIVGALNLGGISTDEIGDDSKLFAEDGLGLDSVDALELVVMLESKYGVSIDRSDDAKSIFDSPNTIADYIISKGK